MKWPCPSVAGWDSCWWLLLSLPPLVKCMGPFFLYVFLRFTDFVFQFFFFSAFILITPVRSPVTSSMPHKKALYKYTYTAHMFFFVFVFSASSSSFTPSILFPAHYFMRHIAIYICFIHSVSFNVVAASANETFQYYQRQFRAIEDDDLLKIFLTKKPPKKGTGAFGIQRSIEFRTEVHSLHVLTICIDNRWCRTKVLDHPQFVRFQSNVWI